jgi:transposase
MVEETIKETGQTYGAVPRVASQLGLGAETLRYWVRQAEMANRPPPPISIEDKQRIADLEQEVRELRRANEILKAASAFFARELDPRLPK